MNYRLAIDGDDEEKQAWQEFVQSEFPEYEQFWLDQIVPLTCRPEDIHLKDDLALPSGKGPEDIAIAQLHYSVLKNLRRALFQRRSSNVDDHGLSIGLSFLVAAQDVAFELLGRSANRGNYDPWLESRVKGQSNSGQDAREDWKKKESYPLQWIRDYRNKLLHGRTPPAVRGKLPSPEKLDKYADWRKAFASKELSDFEYPSAILDRAWNETLQYLSEAWRKHLITPAANQGVASDAATRDSTS